MATQTGLFSPSLNFHPNFYSSLQATDYPAKGPGELSCMDSMAHQQLKISRNSSHHNFLHPSKARTLFRINSKSWYDENYSPTDKQGQSFYGIAGGQEGVWETVYTTSGLVFGVAKTFVALCNNFRVDLLIPAANILSYIEKAEMLLQSGSVIDFVFAVEDLYFSLFARLEIEIAFLHFCISFGMKGSRIRRRTDLALPEPSHVYTILTACKEILNDKDVCSGFDARLVDYHQRRFVEEMTRKYQVDGTLPPNATGYRAHVEETIQNPSPYTYQQWRQDFPELRSLPIDILAFLSEKYLPIYPRTISKNSQMKFNLPFVSPEAENPAMWEMDMIRAHRLCALAQLEGKAVGELRREEEPFNVLRYASEQKCVCLEICTCSKSCSKSGSTLCPCSSRWVRGIMIHRPEYEISYPDKSTIMGELAYESLACLKRDKPEEVMRRELYGGIDVIRTEMTKQRSAYQTEEVDIMLIS